ncbi:DUF485 domain-containing protein [Paraburkholderia phytofirmans]|uniref:DUF485 domain-containing protein n=1 Tax=Paraburkholderia phytofirmans (strain DSM 17436 / LMG 22146 / PsJN) TaxID=398527 RepID=B2T5B4_PARPJ|nr:DUF485 domain-containing protein [Paraburkholderia phytofirmans]ACD16779.1 hypothetical protein Bphyt_2381 [Paraburkholderia phytofirmans PsJN]
MQSMESINAEFERQNATKVRLSRLSLDEKTRALAKFRNRFVWSLLYTSLGIYFGLLIAVLEFPGAMSLSVYGELNLGLLAVVVQFALTIATFWAYCAWAERVYDPKAAELLRSAFAHSNGDRHE